MPEILDQTETQTQQPPTKASKLYNNLMKEGYTKDNLGSEDEFTKALLNPQTADKIYTKLRGDGYSEDNLGKKDEFLSSFSQKKNQISNVSAPTSGENLQPTPKVKNEFIPSREEFESSIPSYARGNQAVSTQLKTPIVKSSAEEFADKSAEKEARNKETQQQAKITTAERRLKSKGIKDHDGEAVGKELELVNKDIADGKLSLSTDAQGNKIYGRNPGVGESLVRGLFGNILGTVDAFSINKAKNFGTPEELRDEFESISARKKKENEVEFGMEDILSNGATLFEKLLKQETGLPTAKPSFAGEVAGMVGGMAPDVALASATGGLGEAMKMGTIGTKMYASAYANTAHDLYERGKQQYISKGMNEDEASKLAATDAAHKAELAALPDAAVNTLFFSGKLHSPAAKNFVSAMGGVAKDAVKMGALGTTQSLAKSGIETAQGYDVKDWVGKAMESGGGLAKMDMLFKVLPFMASLPKYAQSAVKEFAVDPVVKPFVQDYLQKVPEGINIMKDIDEYEKATAPLRGVVSEEKMASLGGRMQKRVNRINDINLIKEEVKQLNEKKANLPESLHEEIDNSIKSKNEAIKELQKEIGNIDGEIEKINKSKGTGLEKEVDEATGEKPFVPEAPVLKGEPEQISQPIELSTETKPTQELPTVSEKIKNNEKETTTNSAMGSIPTELGSLSFDEQNRVKGEKKSHESEISKDKFISENPHSGGALTGNPKKFDELPNDSEVWVFTATTPDNAKNIVESKEGYTPQLQGQNIKGASNEIYVGSDPRVVSGLGKTIVAIKIKKSNLGLSPEAENSKQTLGRAVISSATGAVIKGKPIEVHIVENQSKFNESSKEAFDVLKPILEKQQSENKSQLPTVSEPVSEDNYGLTKVETDKAVMNGWVDDKVMVNDEPISLLYQVLLILLLPFLFLQGVDSFLFFLFQYLVHHLLIAFYIPAIILLQILFLSFLQPIHFAFLSSHYTYLQEYPLYHFLIFYLQNIL